MARKVMVTLVDDLDNTEIQDGKGETVGFALDGTQYEIDLTDKNAKALRTAFTKYVEAARKVSNRGTARGVRHINSARSAGTGRDRNRTQEIRSWAVGQGLLKENSRGRIPNTVVEQFEAAQAS